MARTSLENLKRRGFSEPELRSYFGISSSTRLEHNKNGIKETTLEFKRSRRSAPEVKIELFDFATHLMESTFPSNSILAADVHKVDVDGEPLIQYIDKHANSAVEEFVKTIISLSVKLVAEKMSFKNAIDAYTEKYKYINEDTLDIAVKESPDLVMGLLSAKSANVLTRSMALLALAGTVDEQYFGIIKLFSTDEAPYVRESAFMGLFNYYDSFEGRHLELKKYFQEKLVTEKSLGVRARLKELLEMMS